MKRTATELIEDRNRLMGAGVSTFYDEPVHFVKGQGVWLWDAEGKKYLDCYNNVPHVGHCNPRVVEAISKQASTLNIHARYLHDGVLDYIEKLTSTMDVSLKSAVMTCTGSEANDIALRMAAAVTGKSGVIATDATYHGNTAMVSQLSKSNIPSVGFGLEQQFRYVKAPDSYRTPDLDGTNFAQLVAEQIELHEEYGLGFSALIICPYFLNEGFPENPDGWLKPTAEVVKKANGILICDEVQSGFGRTGTHLWAHEKMGIVPDVVTLGKPMANGHPVGAVVTTSDILKAFQSGYRYFNTFGGNPVSCAAAMAVLEELEEEDLQNNARVVGEHVRQRLKTLHQKYDLIGDTRGSGLIFGAELVLDRDGKLPASNLADQVVNAMRHRGIIHSKLGRNKNILKIRPPMPFSIDNANLLIDTLDDVLAETPISA